MTRCSVTLVERLQQDVPRFAIGARPATERDAECQHQRGNLPALLGEVVFHPNAIPVQQVLRRVVPPVLVLDALEHRELTARAEVNLELPYTVHNVVVDALGELPPPVRARLPASFENVPWTAGVGNEFLSC